MTLEDFPPDLSVMDENAQHREVYAQFGRAMYFAQVVEHGLVNALVCCQPPGPLIAQRETVDPFEKWLSRTFGSVLREFQRVASPPSDLAAELEQARVDRNTLAHPYFRLRAVNWYSEDGRQGMANELFEITGRFRALDERLEDIVFWVGHRYGVTREGAEQVLTQLSRPPDGSVS